MKLLLLILSSVSLVSSQYNFRISENRSPNTFVGQILVKSVFRYEFYEKGDMFVFDELNGVIRTQRVIDREAIESPLISVLVYERQVSAIVRTISINIRVTDENDNPPLFTPSIVKRTVVENAALLTEIGIPTATDGDSDEFGLRNNYRIESGNEDGRFQLIGTGEEDRGSLALKLVRPLDRESRSRYNLTISVDDKGQPPLVGRLHVELLVDDYNDNSPVFSPSKYIVRINETAPIGSTVVTVHASDADSGENSRISYRFRRTKAVLENEFRLDDITGNIILAGEMACHKVEENCLLIVEAYDHGEPSLSAVCYVTVSVIRINKYAPRLRISYVHSQSDTAFIEVGRVTKRPLAIINAEDDDHGGLITVSLVPTRISSIFSVQRNHDNLYLLRQVSETNSAHPQKFAITLKAVDSGSPQKESITVVNIHVNDRNTHFPRFLNRNLTVVVSEDSLENSFVAKLQAIDKDSGLNGKVTYSILNGNTNDVFDIGWTSGLLTLRRSLWFSPTSSFNITIIAKDSGISPLQSMAFVFIVIKKSFSLKARFKMMNSKTFSVNSHTIKVEGFFFVHNFKEDIEVSNETRMHEIVISVLNSNFEVHNQTLVLSRFCYDEGPMNVTIILTHSIILLDKSIIVVSISPEIFVKVCWSSRLRYFTELPPLFSYNLLLLNLAKTVPFDGIFQQLSYQNNFFVTENGQMFWRSPSIQLGPTLNVNILYKYSHKGVEIYRNITVSIFYSPFSNSIFNCLQLQAAVNKLNESVDLGNFLENNGTRERPLFIPSQDWTSSSLKVTDSNRLHMSGEFTGRLSVLLVAYNSFGHQTCSVHFHEKERYLHFRTEEHEKGAKVGEIKIYYDIDLSYTTFKLSGPYSHLFIFTKENGFILLRESLEGNNLASFLTCSLTILDSRRQSYIDTLHISAEVRAIAVSAEFKESSYTFVVPENVTSNTPLERVELVPSQSFVDYELHLSDNLSHLPWSIFPDGWLYITAFLDYERSTEYDLEIVAVNKIDKIRRVSIQIKVLIEDVNDNDPIFLLDPYYFDVTPKGCNTETIGRVIAVDDDSGLNGALEYTLIESSFSHDLVEIDSYSGIMSISGCMLQMMGSLHTKVAVTDFGNPRRTKNVSVYVNIKLIIPTKLGFTSKIRFEVFENTTIGSVVGKLDTGNCHNSGYTIGKGGERRVFSINNGTGNLILREDLNRQKNLEFFLTVTGSCPSISRIVSIRIHIVVIDANDNKPTFLEGSKSKIEVKESVKVGSILARYTAIDLDDGKNGLVNYRLEMESLEGLTTFRIDPYTGIIYLNRNLDYEYRSRWILNITAFDLGNPSLYNSLSVTIDVINVNDHKPSFPRNHHVYFTVPDNLDHDMAIGKVVAEDPDKNQIYYKFLSVEPSSHPFKIDPSTGIISCIGPVMQENLYNVDVMAIDAENQHWFSTQHITISDHRKEEDHIDILNYGAMVLPSTLFIGDKVSTIESRLRGRSKQMKILYKIVNSSISDLIINSYTGDLFIHSKSPIEFNFIDVTIAITLERSSTKTTILYTTKLIRNLDNPYNLNFQKTKYVVNVFENETIKGTKLIRLNALYPGNPIVDLQYFITDLYMGISSKIRLPSRTIALDPVSGWLSVGADDIDREEVEGGQITVEVLVFDRGKNGTRTCTTKVFLNILDRNDNRPIFSNETYIFHVPENVSLSHPLIVGRVQAEDKDLDSILVYDWIRGNPSIVNLDRDTGVITTSSEISADYETIQSISLIVSVSDGLFSSTASVLIIIDDINDNGPTFVNQTYSFHCRENVPKNTIVGQILATDEDSEPNARIRYSLISEWGRGTFSVHPDHGIISTMSEIDYEKGSHYLLLVTATDTSQQALISAARETVTTTVVVIITNENDNGPLFASTFLNVSVAEDAPTGTPVAQLRASDLDVEDILQFEITSFNDNLFDIDPVYGIITLVRKLDFEEAQHHVLEVICTDGSFTTTATVNVMVNNIDDEVPLIHNPPSMVISASDTRKSHFIHCTDKDKLHPLRLDLRVDHSVEGFVKVNSLTGEISRVSETTDSIEAEFRCSDGKHLSTKNVTIRLAGRGPQVRSYVEFISGKDGQNSILETTRSFKNHFLNLSTNFSYFIQPSKVIEFRKDWRFFNVDRLKGSITSNNDFEQTKNVYRFNYVAVPFDFGTPHVVVDISISYNITSSCHPMFVRTPYKYKILFPVTEPRKIGNSMIKYCTPYIIEYYLSSGHSFFTVNVSTGSIFVHRTPPNGLFHYKLTAVINSPSKKYISTTFTVLTMNTEDMKARCQYNTLRLFARADDPKGTEIGRLEVKNLPKRLDRMLFVIKNSYFFTVDDEGRIVTFSNLSSRSEMSFEFTVFVTLITPSKDHLLECQTIVEVSPQRGNCNLSLSYPGTSINLKVSKDILPGSFIFTIPISHNLCEYRIYETIYQLKDPSFAIDSKSGNITTKTMLLEGPHSFSVFITSSNASRSLAVTFTVLVLPNINNIPRMFKEKTIRYSVLSNAPTGTSLGQPISQYIPESLRLVSRYSIVSFCCGYLDNIAVYNNSLQQTPFHLEESTGLIYVQRILSPSINIYHLTIRAYVWTSLPQQYHFEDVEVAIYVTRPPCSCNQRYFKSFVTEESNEKVVVVENVLVWDHRETLTVSIHPESIQRHFYYDESLDSIMTTGTPVDYEAMNEIELILKVANGSKDILQCMGVVHILDINDNAPRFVRNYFIGDIVENSPAGIWIVDVEVVDLDSYKFPIVFSLSGDGNENFRIDSQNGSVYSNKKMDREQKDNYNLKVKVSDGLHALETGMLITVIDVNDNIPRISTRSSNRTIVINRSSIDMGNFTVLNISATDLDDPLSNNSKVFCGFGASGVIVRKILSMDVFTCYVTINPKYKYLISSKLTLNLEIVVSDKGYPSHSNSTFLKIYFIDERSEIRFSRQMFRYPFSVLQTSSKGTDILLLTVLNKDRFENFGFTIVQGNGSSYFLVDSTSGKVSTKDYLKNTTVGTWYSIYVQACATHKGSSLVQCTNVEHIYIVICDFNLHSPEITVDRTTVTVPEDIQVGKRLFKVRIFDKDEGLSGQVNLHMDSSSKYHFSIVPSPLERNSYDLVTNYELDYEKDRSHRIILVVRDLGSPSRSQVLAVSVLVTDVDDNAPYYSQKHIIIRLQNARSAIKLPLAQDDDSITDPEKNHYSISPQGVAKVQLSEQRLQVYLSKSVWNRSSLHFTISAPGNDVSSNCENCSKLKVYVFIKSDNVKKIICPLIDAAPESMVSGLHYHILSVKPQSTKGSVDINQRTGKFSLGFDPTPKYIIFSISRMGNSDLLYEVCDLHTQGRTEKTSSPYTLNLPKISIETNIDTAEVVGRMAVFKYGKDVSRTFQFSLFSSFFLPFNSLNRGEVIVAFRQIDTNIHYVYNVRVKATYKNLSSGVEDLEGNLVIEIGTRDVHIRQVTLNFKIREMVGHGIVLGRIHKMVEKSEAENFFLDGNNSKGPISMDSQGILRVNDDIDRELLDSFRLGISSRQTRVSVRIQVQDENDCVSTARKTTIVMNIEGSTDNLGKVVRTVPIDRDIVGGYRCRLESLLVPPGLLLTPDCWLYIVDPLILSNLTNYFTVLHHDGFHHAVKSIFYLEVPSPLFMNKQNEWSLLLLPSFDLNVVLPRLRLLKVFLHSIQINHFLLGLNPIERYIIIRVNDTSGENLKGRLVSHISRIEAIFETERVELLSDICDPESCNFHGSCSSLLRTDYEKMFTDDDQLGRGDIQVFPLITVTRTCSCQQGYVGATCNISSQCPYQMCHNGGTCGQDRFGKTVCECSAGFTGDRCDHDYNECQYGDWCGSNGKCVNILGGYKCECNLEWSGTSTCNRPFNHCLANQCSLPGTMQCIPTVGGFTCQCGFGYYGERCELSAISLTSESSIQWELSSINTISLEFATIAQNAPLLNVVLSTSLKVKVNILMGKLRLSLVNHNQILHYRQSIEDVANGKWIKILLIIRIDIVYIRIMECGELGDCERTNTIYDRVVRPIETLVVGTSLKLDFKHVSCRLGNDHATMFGAPSFFVGCIRNIEIRNVSILNKKEINVLYNSCPRYKLGISPCGNAARRCGDVGDCVDEWFVARCICPEGYQPPFCTPGYTAFSLAPNTIISFVQRVEYSPSRSIRKKRDVSDVISDISFKIKTTDFNSIIMLSFSSLHTFTVIQISDGMIKIVDKFAGSSQEMVHRALGVNDNKIHSVTVSRSSLGKLSVTVDSVVAIVEWLQSHDPLGPSVQTVYIAGVPHADRTDELIDLLNYSGCLSDVRFNNKTQPLMGLTERFNVSVIQGQVTANCSSDVCMAADVCGKYQICTEVLGVPYSFWGQYQCVNNERSHLIAILVPILVCVIVCTTLILLLICLKRRRSRLLKAKSQFPNCDQRSVCNKKYTKAIHSRLDNADILNIAKKGKPQRSATSSTLLMQDIDRGDSSHPDLIPTHRIISASQKRSIQQYCDPTYYQDTSLVNPYMSSGQLDHRIASAKLHPRMGFFKQNHPGHLSVSNNALQGTDDSLVYRCSHPDEYEAMSSQQSSNSQEAFKPPLSHRPPIQSNQRNNDFFQPLHLKKPCLSSSSSSTSQRIPLTVNPTTLRSSMWNHSHKQEDVFSNNESNFTASVQVEESNDSLSSRDSGHNVFTPTNSSDSMASNKNGSIPNTASCWKKIQRALPPPPQSEEHYEYADVTNMDQYNCI